MKKTVIIGVFILLMFTITMELAANNISPYNLLLGDIILLRGENDDHDLIPGMFAHVAIFGGSAGKNEIWDYQREEWIPEGQPWVIHSHKNKGVRTDRFSFINQYQEALVMRVFIREGGGLNTSMRLMNTREREDVVQFAKNQLGKSYDYNFPSKQVYGDSYYCSELVWAAYKAALGINLDGDGNPSFDIVDVTPEDLYWGCYIAVIAADMDTCIMVPGYSTYKEASNKLYYVTMEITEITYHDNYESWLGGNAGEMYIKAFTGDPGFPTWAAGGAAKFPYMFMTYVALAGDSIVDGVEDGDTVEWHNYHYGFLSYDSWFSYGVQAYEDDARDQAYPLMYRAIPPSTWHEYIDAGCHTIVWRHSDIDYSIWFKIETVETERLPCELEFVNKAAPYPPSNPSPENGKTGVWNMVELSVVASDPDSNSMNVKFYGKKKSESSFYWIESEHNVKSGSRTRIGWTGLEFGTMYEWYAVASDSNWATRSPTWSFTTSPVDYNPGPPDGTKGVSAGNDYEASITPVLTVTVYGTTLMDVDFYGKKKSGTSYSKIGVAKNVKDGGRATIVWPNRHYDTAYEWYVKYYNGKKWLESPAWSFTTENYPDNPPSAYDPCPVDEAGDADTSVTLSVEVYDKEGGVNVYFYDAFNNRLIGNTGAFPNERASVNWSGLSYSTTYAWYVLVFDGKSWVSSPVWSFTTKEEDESEDSDDDINLPMPC